MTVSCHESMSKPMNIVITGGLGQLGRALQSELSAHVLKAVDLPEVDISDLGQVTGLLDDASPDLVIN